MDTINETVGEMNHVNGHSTEKLAKFFQQNIVFGEFEKPTVTEELILGTMFQRVSESLDFLVSLQRKVLTHIERKFTSEQLSFIFQTFNSTMVDYNSISGDWIKQSLLENINSEGRIYDLGDLDDFKTKIVESNTFELEVLVNLIIEAWNMNPYNGSLINELLDALKSD